MHLDCPGPAIAIRQARYYGPRPCPFSRLIVSPGSMTLPRFKRILLKLSGEVLMGKSSFGIDPETVARVAGEIAAAKEAGHELCLVVGGGNIRSEEHTSELQSLMRISYAVFCLKKKKNKNNNL